MQFKRSYHKFQYRSPSSNLLFYFLITWLFWTVKLMIKLDYFIKYVLRKGLKTFIFDQTKCLCWFGKILIYFKNWTNLRYFYYFTLQIGHKFASLSSFKNSTLVWWCKKIVFCVIFFRRLHLSNHGLIFNFFKAFC